VEGGPYLKRVANLLEDTDERDQKLFVIANLTEVLDSVSIIANSLIIGASLLLEDVPVGW
jgi:hypothetical protein